MTPYIMMLHENIRLVPLVLFMGIAILLGATDNGPLKAETAQNKQASPSEKIRRLFDQSWSYFTRMHKDPQALEKAADVLKKAQKLAPDNEDVYWKLAEVTFKMADEAENEKKQKALYEKTNDYAEKALALNPQSVGGHYWKGCACARLAELSGVFSALGLVKESKEALYKTIEIDSDHRYATLARSILAAIYTQAPWPLKDLEKAEELATEAVKKDPCLTLAALHLARVYMAQGEKEKARRELKRGLAIEDPTYIWDAKLYDWPAMQKILKKIKSPG